MDKKKKQRIRFLLKISCGILYVLGVSWIFVGFPLISVITGEFSKPREIYIDEHSLQTNFNSLDTKSLQMNMPALQHEFLYNYSKTKSSFCDLMSTIIKKSDYNGKPNSKCLQFKTKQESKEVSIDVMKIEPNSAPTETNEAIAILIMPPPSRTSENADEFFLSFLLLIHRLSLSHNTRWLSKTLYFVCPSFFINDENNITAKEVSAAFLDAYYTNGFDFYSDLDLPLSFIFPHIRNLLIFEPSGSREFFGISQTDDMKALKKNRGDNDNKSGTPSRIRILPQGYKGMLPNLDMVFSFVQILKSSTFLNGPYHRDQGILSIHPHSLVVENTIKAYFSESSTFLRGYIRDMLNLLAFMKTSIVGPFPPHANFLERGIDSLTIQVDFLPDDKDHSSSSSSSIKNKNDTTYTVSLLIVDIEKMIRAISSLYEQLHHSHTQYLMSSPTKFTSHTEYIIPTLLLVLTAVIRALYLLIFKFGSKSYCDTMEINNNQEKKKKSKEEKGENTNMNEDEVISTDNECKTIIDKVDQTKQSNNIDDSISDYDMQQIIRMDRRQNIKMMKQTIYILCFIYTVLSLAVLALNMFGMAQTKKALLYYVMVYSYLLLNVRKMYMNCIIPTKNDALEEEVLKQKKDTKDTSSSTKSAEYHEVFFLSQMKFSYCVQFSLCLLCIYTHIPLVLAHVSLCIPPLVCLWSPIISILFSFLDYDGDKRKSDNEDSRKIEYSTFFFRTRVVSIGMSFFWVLSFPPMLFSLWLRLTDEGSLDAVRIDDSGRFVFNPYVIFVHTPLHLLLGLLCFMHFRIR